MRKKYFTYFVTIQTISILGALSSILEAYCMGEVVDNVGGSLTEEFVLVLIIGINMLCQIAANISGNYLMNRYTNEKRADISRAAAHKLLNVRFCDVDRLKEGYVLDLFGSDIEKMLAYDRTVFSIGAVFIRLGVSLGCLLYRNVMVGLCIIAASVLSLVPGILTGNLQYEKNRQLSGKEDELNGHFMRMIGLVKLIKSYTSEEYYMKKIIHTLPDTGKVKLH